MSDKENGEMRAISMQISTKNDKSFAACDTCVRLVPSPTAIRSNCSINRGKIHRDFIDDSVVLAGLQHSKDLSYVSRIVITYVFFCFLRTRAIFY